MKKVLSIILGTILTIGIVGCTTTESLNKPIKEETKQEVKVEKEEAPKENNKTKVYGVGETVGNDKIKITLNSVGQHQETNQFSVPKEGFEFFKANVTIENTSDEEKAISSLMMFKMVDDKGVSYNLALAPSKEGSLDGTIAPGRKMTGDYVAEVKPDVKLDLEIRPYLETNDMIIFKLR